MILKPIENKAGFFEFSAAHTGVFGSGDWLSIYGDKLQLIGIYKDEHQLIGGFYYLNIKKYGFNFVKLPPYSPHCGLFFVSDSKNRSSASSFSKEVIGEVCDYFSRLNPALTILAFPSGIVDLQPFIWNKFKVVPNYTYRINLANTLENIVANFDPKNRNAINKAVKENVTVQKNELDKTALYNFFVKSLTLANANIYKSELKNIFLEFSKPGNSFSMEARLNGNLLGIVFCVYDKNICYYLLGGVNKDSGIQGVNNLLIKESISYAKELGCGTFDFEGSMLKGVEKFFRSFGPELFPYYTVNKAKLPLEIMLKFKKRELF